MRLRWPWVLFLLLLPFGAAVAGDEVTAEIAQVNTSKYPDVTLYVSVVDSGGRIVEGLTQDDFAITEDGAPVEITAFSAGSRSAIATVLTIDHSGSMGSEGKLEGAKSAATAFVDLMREQDQAALVVFDDSVDIVQPFTSDKAVLANSIRSVGIGGCTAWYDAVYNSADLIASLEGRRSVILLSDGMDCSDGFLQRLLGQGSSHSLDQAIDHASKAGIPVYAIGLGRVGGGEGGFDEEKLQRVAAETGGKFYHAPSAAELKELYRSLSMEMQKEYVLTYRSPRPTYDGTRRDIVVAISRGSEGGGATTRGGYLEKHLVNIRSDWRWFLVLLVPLLLLLALPTVQVQGMNMRRNRLAGEKVSNARVSDAPSTGSAVPAYQPVPPPSVGAVAVPSSCPSCGAALRAGARFCGSCGYAMTAHPSSSPGQMEPRPPASEQVSYCPDCGHPLRSRARFCGGCGRRFS